MISIKKILGEIGFKIKNRFLLAFLRKLLGLEKLEKLFIKVEGDQTSILIKKLIDLLSIKITLNRKSLLSIPRDKPLVVISNHPTGIVDGLIILHLINNIRPSKVVVNSILNHLDTNKLMSGFNIYVNAFDEKDFNNIRGIKEIINEIELCRSVIFFPAGDISDFDFLKMKTVDKKWNSTCLKLIYKLDVNILPIKIEGRNSLKFHLLNKINNKLGLALMVNELFNKQNKKFKVEIGDVFQTKKYINFEDFEANVNNEVSSL